MPNPTSPSTIFASTPRTWEYGSAFESFLFQEIKAFCDYHQLQTPGYWRSKSNFEVYFVFENIAVESKARAVVGQRDLRGLRALREKGLLRHYILVCMEPNHAPWTAPASCLGSYSSTNCGTTRCWHQRRRTSVVAHRGPRLREPPVRTLRDCLLVWGPVMDDPRRTAA